VNGQRHPEGLLAGFDYDHSDIHLCYDASRKLPSKTERLWMEAICEYVSQDAIEAIVDLGCGTGRFTQALSDHFSAHVLGIEPSRKMLAVARQTIVSPRIQFVQGRAQAIPLVDGWADMTFLSMVYHHLQSKEKAIGEIARGMRRGGLLCIRTATLESVHSYLWIRFFPRARQIETARMPSRDGLTAVMRASGLELKGHVVVQQFFAGSLREYLQKISLRGISSLRMLTEAEFRAGLCGFEEYCRENETGEPILEDIDLFVFCVR